jgi:hypothetical protein
VVEGNITISGRARSTEPSYSYIARSSGLESTLRGPTVERNSEAMAAFIGKMVYLPTLEL